MNQLTKFLVDGILNEAESDVVTALFAGGFKPPTKGHLEVVLKAIKENPEIDQIYIVVGSGTRNGISQSQSIKIWEKYKKFIPKSTEIIESGSPIAWVKDYLKDHTEDKTYVLIGAREGDIEDEKDVEQRSNLFQKYGGEIKPIYTVGGISGTKARAAAKQSKEAFYQFIPDQLSTQDKEEIYNIILPTLNEGRYDNEILTQSRYILNKFKENLGEKYVEKIKSKILGFSYNLYINMAPSTIGRLGPNPFIITGQATEPNIININIRYIPSSFPAELNNLNAELKGTLRHEIEHLSQYNLNKGMDDEEDQDVPLYDYFLLPSEIPAFVNELYKIAKTKKISLTQAIDDFFEKYKYELEEEEIAKVKQTWKDWARKNLPKVKLNEVGEGSSKPYKWEKDFDEYVFTTDNNIGYIVSLNEMSEGDKMGIAVEFLAKTPEMDGYSSKIEVGRGELFRVMATIIDIIKSHLSKDPEIEFILYSPSKKTGEEDIGNQRDKLYKIFLQKQIPGIRIRDIGTSAVIAYLPQKSELNENASYSSDIDYKQYIKELTKHMLKKGMNITPLPKVIFKHGDSSNARDFFGKTAYYNPNNQTIILYTEGRHPKDIVRSFSHEMIHHTQNLENRLGDVSTTNTMEDDNIDKLEQEANLKGTMTFRNWTDSLNEDLSNISLDYIKTKLPKLDSYPKSDIILSKGDFVYLEIPQDANNPYSMVYEIKVFDIKDGTLVAQSSFDYDDNNKLKGTLDVRPDKRRMGIATEIYKLAEKIIGDTIFPEEKHTEDAEKFWRQKNRSFGPQNYDSLNEISLPKATQQISKLNPEVDAEEVAKDFIRLSPNLGKKDLFQYSTYDELKKELDKASQSKSQRRNQAKSMDLEDNKFIFYKDDNFTIYKLDDPSQHPESCEIAQGAKICVASNSKKYWNQYMIDGDGVLFYIRNKKHDIPHPQSVIAFMFPRKGLKIGYTEMVDYNDDDFIEHGNYEEQKGYLSSIGIPSNVIEKMFKFIPDVKPLSYYIKNHKGKKNKLKVDGKTYFFYTPDAPPSMGGPKVFEDENGKVIGVIKPKVDINKLSPLQKKWLKFRFPDLPNSIIYEITNVNKYWEENHKEINLYNIENNKLVKVGKAHLPYGPEEINTLMSGNTLEIPERFKNSDSLNENILPQEKFAQETNQDYIEKALAIFPQKEKYNLKDYTVKILPIDKVKPTQFGEDYINASSEYEAEQYQKYIDGEISAKDLRREDFYPIVVDKDTMKILDGNHRHAVHKMLGIPKIKAILVSDGLNESFYLNIPKFNQPKKIQQHLIESINEIGLSKDNAVEINGDLTGGTFTVGDITYEYSIKNIENPYKDLGLFYNVQFTPKGEVFSTPQGGKENYIKILSTMYKIIVDFIKKEKPKYLGISSLDNSGDKNYHTVYNRLTTNNINLIPGYFRKESNLTFDSPQGKGRFIVLKKKDSLNEVKYTNPNFELEWEEAVRYPEFKEMGKENWIKVAKQGKLVNYSSIKDVLGNVDLNFDNLEEPKKQRFQSAFKKGTIETPIAVKFSDSDYDLIAGNTRLSGLVKNGEDPKIWIVNIGSINEYDNSGPTTPKVYIVKDDGTYKEAPIELLSKISNLTYDMGGGETNYYPEKNIVIVDNIPVEEFAKEPGDIKGEKVYVEYNLNNPTSLPKANKIIASQLVYHLDNREAFAQTVANSLKDGGTFEFQSDLMNKKDKMFLQHLSDEYGFGLPTKLNQYKQESLPLKKGEFVEPIISYIYKITDKDGKTATLSTTKKGKWWEYEKIDGDLDFKTGKFSTPPIDPDPDFRDKKYTLRTFDKYLSYFGDSNTIVDFEKLNESNKPYKHKHGFDDKLGKDPFGLNQFAREIAEEVISEGRYDTLANKLSSIAFEAFKDIHDRGDKEGSFKFRVDHPDDEHDIPSEDFYFDFEGVVEITDGEYGVDGGANAGFDDGGNEITPLLSVKFKIPKNPDWQKVSFDIKDVVRHELEHLTQDGENERSGKYIEDDQLIRDLIDADMLPKSQYFKLEKEVDAMLQGLYFKAKKAKRPFGDVINDYLNIFIDQETITQEEKEEVLNIWRSRGKSLSLPLFESEGISELFTIYLDLDGVIADFDKRFTELAGMGPREYEDSFGREKFWDFIDIKHKIKFFSKMDWMPEGKKLYNFIKQFDHKLLSAPSKNDASKVGKRIWAKENTPETQLILSPAHNKKNYADKSNILIDDRESNIQQWREAGGIGILFKSTDQVIDELKKIMNL